MKNFLIKFHWLLLGLTGWLVGCADSTTQAYYTTDSGGKLTYYSVEMPSFGATDSCVFYRVFYRLDSLFEVQEESSFYEGSYCERGDTVFYKGMALLNSADLNDCWVFKRPYYPSDEYRACLQRIIQDTLIQQVWCSQCRVYYIENTVGTVDDYPVSFYYDPDRRLMVGMTIKNEYGKIIQQESINHIK